MKETSGSDVSNVISYLLEDENDSQYGGPNRTEREPMQRRDYRVAGVPTVTLSALGQQWDLLGSRQEFADPLDLVRVAGH